MDRRRTFGSDQPPTLLDMFEPPEGHLGGFGWLCGYSADPYFLNAAAERFTRRTQRRRAAEGDIAFGLVLDSGSPRISIVDAPGVLHFPLPQGQAFRLMHAKVSLLGFRAIDSDGWLLRLVVSTGNWTRETLEESLDLACCIEVAEDDLGTEEAKQRLVDVNAGAGFLMELREQIDDAPLRAASSVTQEAAGLLDQWTDDVGAVVPSDLRPRFIESRTEALLPQIVSRISEGRRNYLAIGSGFYEGGVGGGVPHVLSEAIGALGRADLLARDPDVAVFVNPAACQSIAGAAEAMAAARLKVRCPGQGAFRRPRTLHAKFLFGAQYDGRSRRCGRAFLYLGSGNFTEPGLLRSGSRRGNLEAGIVLAPDGLTWESDDRGGVPVKAALPITWDDHSVLKPEELASGGEMPDRSDVYRVAPVTHFIWTPVSEDSGLLTSPDEGDLGFSVLDPSGAPCRLGGRSVLWAGPCPREVTVTWTADDHACSERVPVIDRDGRVGATPLSLVALDEVWSLLADFPNPPADDDEPGAGDGGDEDDGDDSTGSSRGNVERPAGEYPIRQVMSLIEQIAARQIELHPADWTAWCTRLQQTLELAAADADVTAFRAMGLNPFSSLLAEPFRPDFAQDATSPEGRLYETALARAATAWQVADLAGFEA